jgi:hypothetical protein
VRSALVTRARQRGNALFGSLRSSSDPASFARCIRTPLRFSALRCDVRPDSGALQVANALEACDDSAPQGWIVDPQTKAKSVVLTEDGERLAIVEIRP